MAYLFIFYPEIQGVCENPVWGVAENWRGV